MHTENKRPDDFKHRLFKLKIRKKKNTDADYIVKL